MKTTLAVTSGPRPMTLELLRAKTRTALAKLSTLPGQVPEEALTIVYLAPSGEEVEISPEHFFSDEKCETGTYRVCLAGQPCGEAKLLDPSATNGAADQFSPSVAAGKFISSLLLQGENSVENARRRQDEAEARADKLQARLDTLTDRNHQLELLVLQLTRRNLELEQGGGSDATLKELNGVLLLLVQAWMGGGPWSAEKAAALMRIVNVTKASQRVQQVLSEEGGEDLVRALLQ